MKRKTNGRMHEFIWFIVFALIFVLNGFKSVANFKSDSQKKDVEQKAVDAISIAKGFLPQGAILFDPYNSSIPNKVRLQNLDNKGQKEIIATYKLNKNDGKFNVLILKQINQNWVKSLDFQNEGIQVDKIVISDLDGDGQCEVLLGRRVGAVWCELEAYRWHGDSLVKMMKSAISYSKFEIVKLSDEKNIGLATWVHDTGKAYKISILKWSGNDFVSVKNDCKDYYKTAVVSYYIKMVKESPKAGFYWYYLIESQLKAGDKPEAVKSMSKAMKLGLTYPTQDDFDKLLEEASN